MSDDVASASRLAADFWSALSAQPWGHDLFQLLRRIDAQCGARYPLGRAPQPQFEPVRIGQQPSLAFAPSTVAQVARREKSSLYDISIFNFGLFGPNGPLPLHLTEYAHQRLSHYQDRGFTAFADLFHHRLALMFYRAWADAQPTVSLDRPDLQNFKRYLACLTGMGQPAQLENNSLSAHARFALAGHLNRNRRDAQGLVKILRHYFQLPVALQQNVAHWQPIDRRDRLRLAAGRSGPRLGTSTFLGQAVRDVQHKFCIELGPLTLAKYRYFLPGEKGERELRNWVRQYLGIEFVWDLRLILHADAVTGLTLGSAARLGFDSWLGCSATGHPRADYLCNPEASAQSPFYSPQ